MKLKGNRVYLRPFQTDDLAPVLAGANEPVGARLTGTHATFTRQQVETYIQYNIAGDDRYAWVICNMQDAVIGEVILNEIDDDNRSANIRIALFDPAHFGKGYGTEAMRLALDYGFKVANLHRVELGVYDFNPRAIRVYEKVGFKQEGVRREALLWDGEYHDEIMMGLLAQEWQTSP